MKKITLDELKRMTNTEGLILQGCGGDLQEWVNGINSMLTDEQILKNDSTFTNVVVFENNGLTNLLFNMKNVNLNIGKLAIWRLSTYETFGGTWLSDYLVNQFEVDNEQQSATYDEDEMEER